MKYGLIGEKLGHSFSKEIHELLGRYKYELKEISKDKIHDFLIKKDFLAINVTIPYKETVIPYLDYIDEKAKLINAVNTVVNVNGKLYGYNTDYLGLKSNLFTNNISVSDKKVLILGTGGTSKTASVLLKDLGAKEIYFASTRKSDMPNVCSYEDAVSLHNDCSLILNATPCGMFPNNDDCIIDLSRFNNLEAVCDVIYNPLRTNLIIDAIDKNVKYCNGLYMLVSQAIYASKYFLNEEIDDNSLELTINNIYNKILEEKENIVLIGMPSSGKSTIASELSKILGKEYVDTDELIENKIGMKIKDFLSKDNENEFREIESSVIKEVSMKNNLIISTGGGIIKRYENIKRLKQNGIIVFIDRPLDLLVCSNDRPLSNNIDDLKKLYFERYDIYNKCSDIKVINDDSIENIIRNIINELRNR